MGSMIYYPLFRVRSWNNGMRCMFLYILLRLKDGATANEDLISLNENIAIFREFSWDISIHPMIGQL